MKLKKLIFIKVLLLSASLVFAAATVNEPGLIDVRSLGMGGMHITDTADFYTILKNPAGLGLAGGKMMISVVSANIGGPLQELPGVYNQYIQGEEITDIVSDLMQRDVNLNLGVGLDGPLCFGSISKNGLGWGFFESVKVDANIPSITLAEVTAQLEVGFVLGYGFTLDFGAGTSISVGASGEAYALVPRLAVRDSLTNIMDMVSGSGEQNQFNNIPLNSVIGLSCDVGAQVRLFDFIDVAAVWEDAYSPYKSTTTTVGEAMSDYSVLFANYGEAQFQTGKFRGGVGLNLLPNGILGGLISSLKVQADVKDIMLFVKQFIKKDVSLLEKSPWLNVTAGAEVGLMHFIYGRVGYSDGFASVGASLKLGAFNIDAALYTNELGRTPGTNSQMNAAVSVGLFL